MRKIIILLSLLLYSGLINASSHEELLSDSSLATPSKHYLNFDIGSLKLYLRCAHVDLDYDDVADVTMVTLNLSFPRTSKLANVVMSGHTLPTYLSDKLDHSLCNSVGKLLDSHPTRLEYTFKLYKHKNTLREVVRVKVTKDLELISTQERALFK